jgi:hypothetical protein
MSEIDPETPPLPPDAVPAQPPILAKIAEPAARHLAHTTAPTAADYARRALAPSTIKRYAADWDDFLGFCRATGRQALPPAASTVADYLASLARSHGRAARHRRLSAIAQAEKGGATGRGGDGCRLPSGFRHLLVGACIAQSQRSWFVL